MNQEERQVYDKNRKIEQKRKHGNKVFLSFGAGILSRKVNIPENCMASGFKLPILKEVSLKQVNAAQQLIEYVPEKVLLFIYKGRKDQGVPVLELVSYS